MTQQRAEQARRSGRFKDELSPIEFKVRRKTQILAEDEHPRDGVTVEGLSKLKPVFKEDGTVHPGNASGITDGAAAMLVMSAEAAERHGVRAMARIRGWHQTGVEPEVMGIGPVPAVRGLCDKLKLAIDDFDLIELNEAFASQVLACQRELGIDDTRMNVNGGSISLGHPIGASGARIARG